MFLLPDGTFFVQLINFAIFFVILNWVFLGPVRKAIEKRRGYIDSLSADYEKAQGEAAELRKQAAHVHANARLDADVVIANARAAAGNEAANVSSDYAAKVLKIVADANATVSSEVAAVAPKQEALANELAAAIVGKVVPEQRA